MNHASDHQLNILKKSKYVIDTFLDALWMERGLSENTLSAYRSDLIHFLTWLEPKNIRLVKLVS